MIYQLEWQLQSEKEVEKKIPEKLVKAFYQKVAASDSQYLLSLGAEHVGLQGKL